MNQGEGINGYEDWTEGGGGKAGHHELCELRRAQVCVCACTSPAGMLSQCLKSWSRLTHDLQP